MNCRGNIGTVFPLRGGTISTPGGTDITAPTGTVIGSDGNVFDPKGTTTRAEAAAMLHRYLER